MHAYFIRRLLLIPLTLLGVTLIVFGITRLLPGGPLEQALAEAQNMKSGRHGGNESSLSPEQQEEIKRYYGFDKPWLQAYAIWLGILPAEINTHTFVLLPQESQKKVTVSHRDNVTGENIDEEVTLFLHRESVDQVEVLDSDGKTHLAWQASLSQLPEQKTDGNIRQNKILVFQRKFAGVLQGNLGNSFIHNLPVWDVIKSRFPVSVYFGVLTLIISYSISIPLGILKALKHKTHVDNLTSILIFVGYAVPGYVLATCLQYLFAFKLDLLPHSGFRGDNFDALSFWGKIGDQLSHTILPLLCYLIGAFAFMSMLMKNELMNNLAADYVRTAIAKGTSFRQAVFRHAFRNSLVPIATSFGNSISLLIMGSFLIENIFDINGFGLLGFTAIVNRDFPLVLGILLISSFLMLLGNVLSDLCVALVDPRIRFDK